MSLDENARRLVEHLQTVLDEAENSDKRNPVLGEKLSQQEIRVLRTVGRAHCCIMSGIAEAIRLSLSSATGLIDRLVDKKLVRRDRSTEDRRIVEVQLTDEGKQLHEAAAQGRMEFARGLLKTLSAEEQSALVALLAKVSGRLKSEKRRA
jgi:DNA-binding MarR family transcriptional regulator